jgi:predicted dehydrogenase
MRRLLFGMVGLLGSALLSAAQAPVRLAIAGLNHGHVAGFLRAAAQRPGEVQIVGIYDPDAALLASYGKTFEFADGVLFNKLAAMLDQAKPEAVAIFSDTYSHAAIVEAVAPRRIPIMMEKPLAVDMQQARAIQAAAARYAVPVIVNYETTWYQSVGEIWNLFHEQKAMGEIRKMVAMDGHQGPREVNVQPEFLAWLGDPAKSGGGALIDFGCYGANLMTWLMDNQRPLKVTAITQTDKPAIYPRVEDEATVLLEYPGAQGIVQASWNWPYDRKDFDIYGVNGYALAGKGANLRVRMPGKQTEETRRPAPLKPEESDSISYLIALTRGKIKPSGLSSLENNMIVTEILDAARESARTGRAVSLR